MHTYTSYFLFDAHNMYTIIHYSYSHGRVHAHTRHDGNGRDDDRVEQLSAHNRW